MALLENTPPADPQRVEKDRVLLTAPEPSGADAFRLYQFYLGRAEAADRLGRLRDRIENSEKPVDVTRRDHLDQFLSLALRHLGDAEVAAGHYGRAIQLYNEAITASAEYQTPYRVGVWHLLARLQLDLGEIEAARATLSDMINLRSQLHRTKPKWLDLWGPNFSWQVDSVRGDIAQYTGHYDQAIVAFRAAIQETRDMQVRAPRLTTKSERNTPEAWLANYRDLELWARGDLARALLAAGRYAEAEAETRQMVRDSIAWFGLSAISSLWHVADLVNCLSQEGRVREAEQLDEVLISLLEKNGIESDAEISTAAVLSLGDLLIYQSRWPEAAAAFDRVATANSEPLMHRRQLDARLTRAVALLKVGRIQEADAVVQERLTRNLRLYGENSPAVALARGLLGAVYAHMGDIAQAQQAFQSALPILLAASHRSGTASDLVTGQQRLRQVVYDEALAFFTHTELSAANADLAFEAMSAAQAGTVQAAIEATAARAVAPNSALGQLLREDQDLAQLEGAISRQLANVAGTEFEAGAAPLRDQLRMIGARRSGIQDRLQAGFPDFTRLLGSSHISIAEVQSALKPDQALVSVYSSDDGTFIWAIRPGRSPSFVHTRQSEVDLQALVARVRQGLEFPSNPAAGLPRFDVAAAYELYNAVLGPVADTWRGADELIVVPHGAMAQIPWSLLLTEPVTLSPARSSDLPFAEYRAVPWLFRSVAVAHVPSIGAFQALAAERASTAPRPFLGVGDPVFGPAQIASADSRRSISLSGVPLQVRAAPVMREANSLHLSLAAS